MGWLETINANPLYRELPYTVVRTTYLIFYFRCAAHKIKDNGRVGDMRLTNTQMLVVAFLLGCVLTYTLVKRGEGFQMMSTDGSGHSAAMCKDCGNLSCPPVPDLSKYVLKTSIPPCPGMPDMTNYMLKTECPPVPDLSQYVLKTSVPKQQPIIIDTSTDVKAKCGECPPCPRPRCPEVRCPAPTVCPAAAPCPRAVCPQTTVKCRAEESSSSPVRPFLAPLGMGFGTA
jgi:hypothetical protein